MCSAALPAHDCTERRVLRLGQVLRLVCLWAQDRKRRCHCSFARCEAGPEEDEFEADTQWAARKTNLSAHGFGRRRYLHDQGLRQHAKHRDEERHCHAHHDFGSIMNQKLWYDLPVRVQQNWHIMNDKRPQDERENFLRCTIGTRFERLCEVEPSPAAVNEFMEVDIVLMLVRTEFGASK